MDALNHECVFVEEQEPNGRLVLPPCLECGLTAMDALQTLTAANTARVLEKMAMSVPAHLTRSSAVRWLRANARNLTAGVNDGPGGLLPLGDDDAPDESKGDADQPSASRPAPAVTPCERRQCRGLSRHSRRIHRFGWWRK